jgi:hypothetical protein
MQTVQPQVAVSHPPNIVELAALWEDQHPKSTQRRSIERALRDTLVHYRASHARIMKLGGGTTSTKLS